MPTPDRRLAALAALLPRHLAMLLDAVQRHAEAMENYVAIIGEMAEDRRIGICARCSAVTRGQRRAPRYCGTACRQAAYRSRRAT